MGLPISDTAMAIFRRWVRNLPLSAADRRHVHHLLIGLGLDPRQAALLLYSFSGFLCGAVLLGVALRSEFLALVLGISGCLAFLVVVTSRRDELTNLRGDLQARLTRGRQERQAAKLTWEAIQRIELCDTGLGRLRDRRADRSASGLRAVANLLHVPDSPRGRLQGRSADLAGRRGMSGPSAVFRLSGGEGLWITVSVELGASRLAADIVFRYLERLGQATGRLERLDGGCRQSESGRCDGQTSERSAGTQRLRAQRLLPEFLVTRQWTTRRHSEVAMLAAPGRSSSNRR